MEKRNYGMEIQELFAKHPEARKEKLSKEVVQACVRGQNLTEAYRAHQETDDFLRGFNFRW